MWTFIKLRWAFHWNCQWVKSLSLGRLRRVQHGAYHECFPSQGSRCNYYKEFQTLRTVRKWARRLLSSGLRYLKGTLFVWALIRDYRKTAFKVWRLSLGTVSTKGYELPSKVTESGHQDDRWLKAQKLWGKTPRPWCFLFQTPSDGRRSNWDFQTSKGPLRCKREELFTLIPDSGVT